MNKQQLQENPQQLLETPLTELVARANRLRHSHCGDQMQLCSIINAKSGRCSEDCKFCAQSSFHASDVEVYGLRDRATLVEAGRQAQAIGAKRFGIVTSGNRLTALEVEVLAAAIDELVHQVGIGVCGSLGALDQEALAQLHQAGMSRYHHNIETSRRYYRTIVTTHDYDQRLNTLRAAQAVGLEVCSGGIIGMGETWEDRIDMAVTLRELGVDSVPINILRPIPGTPFEHLETLSVEEVVRTLAIFRILLPTQTIKIAAGREATLGDKQVDGFAAGANGMIIGGYLTIQGAALEADQALVDEVTRIWNQSTPS